MLIISLNKIFFIAEFEVYLKSKIEKLAKIETQNLDCKSPDYHFCAKSIDESKASVYFTPTDGHLSPQPLQMSPIHVNYINDGLETGIDEARGGSWRAVALRNSSRSNHLPAQTHRNSFLLPGDYLDEEDESMGNFIVPDPIYCDEPLNASCERFQDVIESPVDSTSLASSISGSRCGSSRRRNRKKRYRDREQRFSTLSVENEAFLMQEMIDVTKGARPKVYDYQNYSKKEQSKGRNIVLNEK